MNAIDEYQEMKRRLAYFEAWASLVGKEYFGGTRGKGGVFGVVTRARGSLTIYHQESDGAANYHEMDESLSEKMEKAMITNAPVLIEDIRTQLLSQLKDSKEKARKLTEELNTTETEPKPM